MQGWLERFVRDHAGSAGAIHQPAGRDHLNVVARVGDADPQPASTDDGWRGRGAAGLALERNAAIFTRAALAPGAEAVFTRAGRATPLSIVAVPVHDPRGEVRAVVEIGFAGDRALNDNELLALDEEAASLPEFEA